MAWIAIVAALFLTRICIESVIGRPLHPSPLRVISCINYISYRKRIVPPSLSLVQSFRRVEPVVRTMSLPGTWMNGMSLQRRSLHLLKPFHLSAGISDRQASTFVCGCVGVCARERESWRGRLQGSGYEAIAPSQNRVPKSRPCAQMSPIPRLGHARRTSFHAGSPFPTLPFLAHLSAPPIPRGSKLVPNSRTIGAWPDLLHLLFFHALDRSSNRLVSSLPPAESIARGRRLQDCTFRTTSS